METVSSYSITVLQLTEKAKKIVQIAKTGGKNKGVLKKNLTEHFNKIIHRTLENFGSFGK